MPHLIASKADFQRILRERRRMGGDRFDEVWNGKYVMAPLADNDHQGVAARFTYMLFSALSGVDGALVYPGANVTDQAEDWTKNYRCPDVLVFLPGNPAEDRGTHWLGGPDFAVEIMSRGDRSRKKLDFYAKVGVRELLLIDRRPWKLELYRRHDDRLELAALLEPGSPQSITSTILPVSFRLLTETPRPRIEVTQRHDGRVWLI